MITVAAQDKAGQEIAWHAHDLLSEEQGLRTTTSDIVILTDDRQLTLNGRVRTNILRELAERLARTASNDWELHNHLISDEDLAIELAGELAGDPRTRDANVRFEVFLGVVYLKGTVKSQEQRAAVLELIQQVPYTVRVEDLLAVAGSATQSALTQR